MRVGSLVSSLVNLLAGGLAGTIIGRMLGPDHPALAVLLIVACGVAIGAPIALLGYRYDSRRGAAR